MAAQGSTHPVLPSLLVSCLVCLTAGTDALPFPDCVQTGGTEGLQATCNNVSIIPTGLSDHLRKLKLVNSTVNVLENGALSHLPRLTVLDLSGNGLTHLRPSAFRGLPQLRHLDLSHNRLCFGDDAFPADVFMNVASLRVLIMHSNNCPRGHVHYPDKALGELSRLETLAMNGLPDVPLGPRFARMTSLKSLELSGRYCNLGVVSKKTFASLKNNTISQLSLRACNITKLVDNAFTPLPRLASLNLACNDRIGFEDATNAIGESTSTDIDTIIIDDVSRTSVIINKRLFASRQFRTVRRLSLRANDIVAINVLAFSLLPAIRNLAVGFNAISSKRAFFPYENQLEVLNNATANLLLEVVDASYVVSSRPKYQRIFCKPGHVDFEDYFRKRPSLPEVDYTRHTKPTTYNEKHNSIIPASLQVIYLDHSRFKSYRFSLPQINITNYNEMVVFNFSNTDMDVIKGPLLGFDNLQVLDFRRCRIYKIKPRALRALGRLKYLFLQHNAIGEKGDIISDQFHGLHSLLELDLSDNKIPSIGRNAFRDLTNIRKLNLRGNRLRVLGFSVSHLKFVLSVDVSHNLLVYGETGFLEDGAILKNTTEINLTNNVFVCNCSSAAFVRWLQTTHANLIDKMDLRCVNNSGQTVVMADIDALYLPEPCPTVATCRDLYVAIIACCLFVVVFLAVAIALRLSRKRRDYNLTVEYSLCDDKITM